MWRKQEEDPIERDYYISSGKNIGTDIFPVNPPDSSIWYPVKFYF